MVKQKVSESVPNMSRKCPAGVLFVWLILHHNISEKRMGERTMDEAQEKRDDDYERFIAFVLAYLAEYDDSHEYVVD